MPDVEPGRGHLLKVAGHSRPASVAGAIAAGIRERGRCELQAIGAGAINQAVKAMAIARAYLLPDGVDLLFRPAFLDLSLDEGERTALRFLVLRAPLDAEDSLDGQPAPERE